MLSAFRRPSYLAALPEACLADLQTGDIVLFSGRTASARLVQLCTGSYWSHVGMVLRLPEYGAQPLLWEATRASKLRDLQRGQIFDGVQLVSLAEKVASYSGEVVVRRLLDADPVHSRYERLRPLLRDWSQAPYRDFVSKQWRAWWQGEAAVGWPGGGFCSELVAAVYQHWSLLPADKRAMDYLPHHFAPEAPLPLVRGHLSAACGLRL